ncbi:MAG: hypothetical protein ABUL77_01770 [Bacteroidota bacterium]
MTLVSAEIVAAAREKARGAREQLDAALHLLPPPDGSTSVASEELTEVLRKVRAARTDLEALEAELARQVTR